MNYLKINSYQLNKLAESNKSQYLNNDPFPHIVLDNFFSDEILNDILTEFPKNLQNVGYEFKTKVEQKKFTLKN